MQDDSPTAGPSLDAILAGYTQPEADVDVRVLEPEELYLLLTIPPFNTKGIPNFGQSRIVVAQEQISRQIVGYWVAFDVVHLEPLWVHPKHQKRPGVLRRMWTAMQRVLRENGVTKAFAMVTDPELEPQAERLGFRPMPGKMFFVDGRRFANGGVKHEG